jgi:hypothetical protein
VVRPIYGSLGAKGLSKTNYRLVENMVTTVETFPAGTITAKQSLKKNYLFL